VSSEFAHLLKEVREKRGLSLGVLAERAGLARQTLSYIEQEKQSPTLDTLLRIDSALGVGLETLVVEAKKRAARKSPRQR
jgi:transcriptional regulator with XRE-family HTH domain